MAPPYVSLPLSPSVQRAFREELTADEVVHLLERTEPIDVPAGALLIREGDKDRDLYVLLEGEVVVVRHGVQLNPLGPGAAVGVLGLLTGKPRAASLVARTPVKAAHLRLAVWERLCAEEPAFALKVSTALLLHTRDELMEMTAHVGRLLQGRTLPRAETLTVRVGDVEKRIATGTTLKQLLPAEVDGVLVVAGLLEQKPVSLDTPVLHDTEVRALTMNDWEGRRVYAHTLGLLLLEAAHQVAPEVPVRMGPSQGAAQLVEVPGVHYDARARLAARVQEAMEQLVKLGGPVRQEHWALEEAHDHLHRQGWDDAAKLLHTHRAAAVALCSLGQVYALSLSPLLPDARPLEGFKVLPHADGLLLRYGTRDPRSASSRELPPIRGRDMAREHREWLSAMGITSVGDFNDRCVSGQVSQLIRVAEGFHEKTIGQVADAIARRGDKVRVITIAGPSSSGKTTFIKRLTVQLQINGLNPVNVSLDDYYVDREKTVKDEKGEYDFEALEALDLALLQEHLSRMLKGEKVTTAKYDFKAGKSHPAGGPVIALEAGDVLMLEGIHGLNPRLLGDATKEGEVYRVFIHPATTLGFDRLTRFSATDLRLLRRIVRDRHSRGYKAQDNIMRWPSVQAGEQRHIFPFQSEADAVFDTSLSYEPAVMKVYAERYLLEVPRTHPAYPTASRLRQLVDKFVAVYPDHVPPTSILREFIGGSGFEY